MNKTFHEPPIQKTHWGYSIAIQFVRSAVTRFHRMEIAKGSSILPRLDVPMIIVSNHQNGLMDPLIITTLAANHQIHWLTRADIFKKPFIRELLFGFNQMPIFRQRDRLTDSKERNRRIFEICIDRLKIGASIGLFPEGNHRAMKSLLPLRRGISDMVELSIRRSPKMKNLVIIPVGIDYEQAESFQRRLSYRVGSPILYNDLYDAAKDEFNQSGFLNRVENSLRDLMIDVQPESRYEVTTPFVKALRTSELAFPAFRDAQALIHKFKTIKTSDWENIERAFQDLDQSRLLSSVRAEDLSLEQDTKRQAKWYLWLLAPFALLGGLPSIPLALIIQNQCEKRVKEATFISTFKASSAMFLFPIFWSLQSIIVALIVGHSSDGWSWTAFFGWYIFNLAGSRFSGYWYSLFLDWKGKQKARRIWNDPVQSRLWCNYVQAMQQSIAKQS